MGRMRQLMDRVSRSMLDTADLITMAMGEVDSDSARSSRGPSLSLGGGSSRGSLSIGSSGKQSLSPQEDIAAR